MPVPEVALTEPCSVDDAWMPPPRTGVSPVLEKARAEFALPETEVAEQAYRFAEQIEPAFVFAHGVRSYLYARAGWAGAGIRDREPARWPRSTRWKEVRSRSSYSLRSPEERVWR